MACVCCLALLLLLSSPAPSSADQSTIQVLALEQRIAALTSQLAGAELTRLEMAQAQLNLATALHSLNNLRPDGGSRVERATAAYRQALALLAPGPMQLQVWGALAALLLDAGQPAAALHELDLALEALLTAAVPVEAHASVALPLAFNRAKALAALGRLREADRAYEQVMAQAHGRDQSTYAKAVAAAEQLSSSRLNQVAALLPQALAVLRASPQQQQGELQDGEERLPASQGQGGWLASISSMEAAWLGFGLYKALDRVGDVAGAWSALTAANQQAAAAWPYSPDPDWRTLATLTRSFTGPLPGLAGWRERTPLFIVGLPRSGSTLVEQLLAAHPQVWAAGEDTLLAPLTPEVNRLLAGPTTSHTHLSRQLQRLGQRYVEGMRALVPAHRQAGSKAGDPPHQPGIRAKTEPPDPLRAAAAASVAAGEEAGAGARDGESEAAHGGGQPGSGSGSGGRQEGPVVRIVDKMLHNLWLVGHIQLLLPDACVVHVARHPLDAGLSCYAQPFASPGMAWSWDLGHIAAQINMTWRLAQHWEATLPGRMHTLLYEELVAHPELAARRLLAACGLDWAPQVLRFHTLDRPVSTASLAQVRKELYPSSVGRWRRYAQQLKPLIDALGGTVAMYERRLADTLSTYPAEAPAPAAPDPLLGHHDTDQHRSFGTNPGNAMASQEHVEL